MESAPQKERSAPPLTHWLDRLLYFLYGQNGRYPEVCLSITAVAWGIWVLNPFWDAFASSPTFSVMQKIAPEDIWGVLGLLLGGSLLYGSIRQYRPVMRWSTLGLCLFWLIVTISVGISNVKGPGLIAYAVYTWLNALAHLRLSSVKL